MVKTGLERDSNNLMIKDLMVIIRRVEVFNSTLPLLRTLPCAIRLVDECRVGTPIPQSLILCL